MHRGGIELGPTQRNTQHCYKPTGTLITNGRGGRIRERKRMAKGRDEEAWKTR